MGVVSDFSRLGIVLIEGEKFQRKLLSKVFHFDYMRCIISIALSGNGSLKIVKTSLIQP